MIFAPKQVKMAFSAFIIRWLYPLILALLSCFYSSFYSTLLLVLSLLIFIISPFYCEKSKAGFFLDVHLRFPIWIPVLICTVGFVVVTATFFGLYYGPVGISPEDLEWWRRAGLSPVDSDSTELAALSLVMIGVSAVLSVGLFVWAWKWVSSRNACALRLEESLSKEQSVPEHAAMAAETRASLSAYTFGGWGAEHPLSAGLVVLMLTMMLVVPLCAPSLLTLPFLVVFFLFFVPWALVHAFAQLDGLCSDVFLFCADCCCDGKKWNGMGCGGRL